MGQPIHIIAKPVGSLRPTAILFCSEAIVASGQSPTMYVSRSTAMRLLDRRTTDAASVEEREALCWKCLGRWVPELLASIRSMGKPIGGAE